MQKNWLNVPHVTQFDNADITDLEEFRGKHKNSALEKGIKLTPVAFVIKAVAIALQENPEFNRSPLNDRDNYVQKEYVNIGMAVDTEKGLFVPVIKSADKMGVWEIAKNVLDMADKARNGALTSNEMQGGCFTVSSLGAIGGNGFTPIVNSPEIGILGVSKAQIKPVWIDSEFVPRLMLPLSLSTVLHPFGRAAPEMWKSAYYSMKEKKRRMLWSISYAHRATTADPMNRILVSLVNSCTPPTDTGTPTTFRT